MRYVILPFIVLYIDNSLWLEGNVYKTKKSLFTISHKEHYWKNIIRILNSYVRGSTRRLNLEIEFYGQSYKLRTNTKGQFSINLSCSNCLLPDLNELHVFLLKNKQKIKIEIPDPFNHCFFSYQNKNTAVISDIDDTVLVTHTLNTIKKIRTLLIKNAFKRKAVRDMRTFYHQFAEKGYPFFYVSNSESNLFPMIRLFLEHNGFPIGPIFLKPFVQWNQLLKRRKKPIKDGHKKKKIEFLVRSFPHLQFILVGDDSQQDPEIYTEIVRRYPGRIKEIYIRNIKKTISRKRHILKSQMEEKGSTKFFIFKNPKQITNT